MEQLVFNSYTKKWAGILLKLNKVALKIEDRENKLLLLRILLWPLNKVGLTKLAQYIHKLFNPYAYDPMFKEQSVAITNEMVNVYLEGNDEQRAKIRQMLGGVRSFRDQFGFGTIRIRTKDDEALYHRALVINSMIDFGREYMRDFDIYRTFYMPLDKAALKAGINTRPHLEEVAKLSSDFTRNLIEDNLKTTK